MNIATSGGDRAGRGVGHGSDQAPNHHIVGRTEVEHQFLYFFKDLNFRLGNQIRSTLAIDQKWTLTWQNYKGTDKNKALLLKIVIK